MKSRAWLLAALGLACSVLVNAACSSDSADDANAIRPTVATEGTLTNADGWPRVEGLRDKRYCEVLLLRIIEGRINAEVWNSFGLSECPQTEWDALDPVAIKDEYASTGVLFAMLNGPRYWTMDAIEKNPRGEERREATFGTLDMFLGATVDVGPPPPNLAPYTERVVARDTVFEYDDGSEVYEIVLADGRAFIMQSYSVQNDATLNATGLAALGERLQLPVGASFRVRTLDRTLRVLTPTGDATVIQDELNNTYQLIED
jgi:hypothetical protein